MSCEDCCPVCSGIDDTCVDCAKAISRDTEIADLRRQLASHHEDQIRILEDRQRFKAERDALRAAVETALRDVRMAHAGAVRIGAGYIEAVLDVAILRIDAALSQPAAEKGGKG